MNRTWKKAGISLSALILSGAVSLNTFLPVMASGNTDNTSDDKDAQKESEKETKAETENKEVGKDETVYVKLNADGSTKSITVSDWLKNLDKTSSIMDKSELSDIKNIKGDESFAAQSDGSMMWTSSGSDIYYQGTTNKELPVTMKISYFLDGKEMTAQEIAGKSGKVTIRYEYTNHSTQTVIIDGKEETIATPFAVVTGMIFSGEKFQNVEVSSGKVISDGSKIIVAGMAFPGLKDSLGLSDSGFGKDLTLPDVIEVTAEAQDFSMDMSASVVTSSIFDEIGIDDIDSIDELTDALDDLEDAAMQLVDGSGELLDGVMQLKSASSEFASGVNELDNGAKQLKSGSQELKNGIDLYTNGVDTLNPGVQQYTQGAAALAQGTQAYVAGASALIGGVQQLAQQLSALPEAVGQLNAGMKDLQQGAAQLADETLTKQLTEGSQAVADGIKTLHDNIVLLEKALEASSGSSDAAAMIELFSSSIDMLIENDTVVYESLMAAQGAIEQVDALKGNLSETAQAAINTVEGQYMDKLAASIKAVQTNLYIEKQMKENLAAFDGTGDSMEQLMEALKQMELATASGTENSLYDGAVALSVGVQAMVDGNKALKSGIDTAAAGVNTLAEGMAALPEGIAQLTKGSQALMANNDLLLDGAGQLQASSGQLTDGAAALAGQSAALRNGAASLFEGASALADGMAQLGSGTTQLTDGIGQLADGAQQLSDGMNEFNEEGIKKLTNTLENDAAGLVDRVKAVVDAGKDYQTFTGLADGVKGSVKFIIETDAVKAE